MSDEVDKLVNITTNITAHPLVKGIIGAVPTIGSVLCGIIDFEKERRVRIMLDELRGRTITEEDARDNMFVHAFVCIGEAALRTENEDKLRCFGRILYHVIDSHEFRHSNSPEECLNIISELTPQEMALLAKLYECSLKFDDRYEQDRKQGMSYRKSNVQWEVNEPIIMREFGFHDSDDLQSRLLRLQRTGCVIVRPTMDGGYTEPKLTSMFHQIRRYLYPYKDGSCAQNLQCGGA